MELSPGAAKSSGAAIFAGTLRSARRAAAAAAFLLLAACGTSAPPAQVSGRAGLIVGLSDGSFTAVFPVDDSLKEGDLLVLGIVNAPAATSSMPPGMGGRPGGRRF